MSNTGEKQNIASAALIFAAALFFCRGEHLPLILIAVLFHELSHYAAIIFFGGDPLGIYASGLGFIIKTSRLSYSQEAIASLAGPCGGIALSFIASKLFHNDYLAGMSMALSLFNLLPIYPLDGGRALFSVLCGYSELSRAAKITSAVGSIFCSLMVAGGVFILLSEKNGALLLSSVWVTISYCKYVRNRVI